MTDNHQVEKLREQVAELIVERDYWKQQVQSCMDAAYPPNGSASYASGVMGYPDRDGCTTPATLLCAMIDGLRDEFESKGGRSGMEKGVATLEHENARLQSQLGEGNQMYHRALERGRELESFARELLAAYGRADANEYRPGEVTHSAKYHELVGMARLLGIETEGGA